MPIWGIDVYENINGKNPTRSGYVNVESETEAIEIAREAMGETNRADLIIRAEQARALPYGRVIWTND
jgi:hypothetical protein